jgi:cysteine desulfurase/selenocysteine lyase
MSSPPVTQGTVPLARKTLASRAEVERWRQDFPLLRQKVHGKPLIYLDNAATTQKPRPVLEAMRRYYEEDNANVHRAAHALAERATMAYEAARQRVQRFLGAASPREIIFTKGCTEAINLVAYSFGRLALQPGDEILLTEMEHHSNIVPWQLVCQERGAHLRVVPITDGGELVWDELERLLTPRTRLLALTHVSNVLGTVNPLADIIALAHRRGVPVLVDGAQAVGHLRVQVRELDCDFYAFSGHKIYGPMGIGVLYGKEEYLERMPPYQGGGDMIRSVRFEETTWADLPNKFEAGTPNVAGAVGLAAALDYVESLGRETIAAHEQRLLQRALERLSAIPGVRLLGAAPERVAVLSFLVEEPPLAPLDIGTQLDLEGIAIRTGHHCCQPLMERLGISGTARASFALYNTLEEVEAFADALEGIVAAAAGRRRSVPVAVTAPAYPPAAAPSPQAAAQELLDTFELFDDWADRYRYLIELGEKLPPMPEELKTEANRVHGCQSTVFLHARCRPGTRDVLEFLADSDADIVRGLLALLQRIYSGQRAADVLAFDIQGFFRRLGLEQNLTVGRRNGLAEMVQRLRRFAATLLSTAPAASSESGA